MRSEVWRGVAGVQAAGAISIHSCEIAPFYAEVLVLGNADH